MPLSFVCERRVGTGLRIYALPIIRSPRGKVILGDGVQLCHRRGGPRRRVLPTACGCGRFCPAPKSCLRPRRHEWRGGHRPFGHRPDWQGRIDWARCFITDSDFHHAWPPEERDALVGTATDRDVQIGDRSWLGAGCIVLKGVPISEPTPWIGAGSVVTRKHSAQRLAAGNPCRVIRMLDASGTAATACRPGARISSFPMIRAMPHVSPIAWWPGGRHSELPACRNITSPIVQGPEGPGVFQPTVRRGARAAFSIRTTRRWLRVSLPASNRNLTLNSKGVGLFPITAAEPRTQSPQRILLHEHGITTPPGR